MTRPQPPPDPVHDWDPPAGFHLEWVGSDGWRKATAEEQEQRKCRRPGCQRQPVAALFRTSWGSKRGRGGSWWLYCDWHLYGRRIANERVEHRRAVKDPA